MPAASYVWVDGKFVRSEDAKVNILTHSLQYGSGIFEGIRCYDTPKGPAVFRLPEHTRRFFDSAKIYGMGLKFSPKQVSEAVVSVLVKNKLRSAYIRPFAFYSSIGIGFNTHGKDTSIAIAAVPFGNLFGGTGKGLRCKVSSWHRINSAMLPVGAKASGNYLNSILASQEANDSGYDEAILLSNSGRTVAEGPGENLFVVQSGVLITPPKSSDILLGITRDTIITLAERNGITVIERDIRREELYTSDEVFFTGTAAEIQPIVSVDSRKIGTGKAGPLTRMLEEKYFAIVKGETEEFSGWLTPVG